MNDKAYAQHKACVDKLMKPIRDTLWLGQWCVTIVHNRLGVDERDTPAGRSPKMSVLSDWRYLSATINCNCPEVEGMALDDVRRVMLHEMLHICVQEMREWEEGSEVGIRHEERVVSLLTNVIAELKGW